VTTLLGRRSDDRTRNRSHGDEPDALHPILVAGWLAKGVVHVVVGILAVQLALGTRSGSADQQGALREIASQPMGGVLLWLVAAGLALYMVGRMAEAWLSTGESGWKRAAVAGKALLYGAIAVAAARIAMGGSSGSSNNQEKHLTARLLDAPAGQWLVGVGGLVIIGAGAYLVWWAWQKKFLDELDIDNADPGKQRVLVPLGVGGITARGVATALIGWFVLDAALQHDPDQAAGLDEALRRFADGTGGQLGLGVVAVGFVAYGIVCIAHARYRRA
jgi:hypothetical protein